MPIFTTIIGVISLSFCWPNHAADVVWFMPIWVSVCFLQLKYSSATLLGQFKPSRLAECIWTIWSQNISLIMIENQWTHSWNNIENGTHEQWQKKPCKTPLVGDWSKKIITIHGRFIWKILKHAGKTGWRLARAVSVKPNAHTCGSTQSKSLKQCLVTFSDTPFDADPNVPRFLIVFVITLRTIAAEWLLPHCRHGLQLRHIVDALVVRHLASRWHLRMVGWYSSGTSFTSHLPKSSKI